MNELREFLTCVLQKFIGTLFNLILNKKIVFFYVGNVQNDSLFYSTG